MHVKGTVTVPNTGTAAALDNRNKKWILKSCASLTNCISEINNTQVDDAHDIDVVMSIYKLIEHNDICWKTSGSLCQYYRDEPVLDGTNNIIDFPVDNSNGIWFKFIEK